MSSFDAAINHVISALESYVQDLERERASTENGDTVLEEALGLGSSKNIRRDDGTNKSTVIASAGFLEELWNGLPVDLVTNLDRTAVIELAMRTYLHKQLTSPTKNTASVDKALEILVDIGIDAANRRLPNASMMTPTSTPTTTSHTTTISTTTSKSLLLEPTAVFTVFEDACESLPVSRLESIWSILEDRRVALFPFVQAASMQRSRLALLRVTSGLLRRLSRTLDTVLCGKILLFLAFILPLSERSGVNVTAQFNTENVTAYEGMEEDAVLVENATAWKPSPAALAAAASTAAAMAALAAAKSKLAAAAAASAVSGAGQSSSASAAAAAAAASSSSFVAPTPEIPTLDGRFHLETTMTAVREAYTAADNGTAAESVAFYRAFWRMQHLLYHPSLAVASIESWNLLLGSVRAVLRAFEREDEDSGIARSIFASSLTGTTTTTTTPITTSTSVSTASTTAASSGSSTGTSAIAASFSSRETEEGEERESVVKSPPPQLQQQQQPTTSSSSLTTTRSNVNIGANSRSAGVGGSQQQQQQQSTPAIPTLAAVTVSFLDRESTTLAAAAAGNVYAHTNVMSRSSTTASTGGGAPPPSLSASSTFVNGTSNNTNNNNHEYLAGAKYLTSPALLKLELKDPTLRRHVVLQFLILMQYFLLSRKGDKDKPPVTSYPPERDLSPLRDLCYALLRRTPPDGPRFVRAIGGILAREVYWHHWKQAGANPFERAIPTTTTPTKATTMMTSGSGDQGGADGGSSVSIGGLGMKRRGMGAMMTSGGGGGAGSGKRLRTAVQSKRPLNWASAGMDRALLNVCAQPSRAVTPQLLAYVLPMKVALDYRSGIDAEYSPANDRLYVWRGLRLLAMENLSAFFEIGTGRSFANAVVEAMHIHLPAKPAPPPAPVVVTTTAVPEETETGAAIGEVEGSIDASTTPTANTNTEQDSVSTNVVELGDGDDEAEAAGYDDSVSTIQHKGNDNQPLDNENESMENEENEQHEKEEAQEEDQQGEETNNNTDNDIDEEEGISAPLDADAMAAAEAEVDAALAAEALEVKTNSAEQPEEEEE